MFSKYRAPGVYVEEVPSLVKAIAGVSTSTPGFIGQIKGTTETINQNVPNEPIGKGDGTKKDFQITQTHYPVIEQGYQFKVNNQPTQATLVNDKTNRVAIVTFTEAPAAGADITGNYQYQATESSSIIDQPLNDKVVNLPIGKGDGKNTKFQFREGDSPTFDTLKIYVEGQKVANEKFEFGLVDGQKRSYQVTFKDAKDVPDKAIITADYERKFVPVVGEVKLCTNFTEFKKYFGDFSTNEGQRTLAHAVYGFFSNGGSRCFVVLIKDEDTNGLDEALEKFERFDEIAIVAKPGDIDDVTRDKLVTHCLKTGDRFAIFDGPQNATNLITLTQIAAETRDASNDQKGIMPKRTDLAAWYFPWIKVFDPVTKFLNRDGDGLLAVPPSGHIAGVYARVDNDRGVFKAPANEAIVGAIDVTQPLSKAEQELLNPDGVNCIRVLNKNILIWGARTIGGDLNQDLKYINVRRTLLYLRESIDEGTQWAVFEPNTPNLWKKITRNVSDFLTNVWRSGALFGNTPTEAFYVKCDEETNPPELREVGQVVTEVGVAIVRPAEFVIFRISQFTSQPNQ